MDIQQAKQQIKYTMQAYFAKDEFGGYALPPQRQRPIFLLGAPGIGKTAIVEQIAQELEVGFVSYSMTHHTRQSALGLPFIAQKEYGGKTYDVSEYTMSEIIAAVYDAIEQTGHREGILFLDEINCVSETLTPVPAVQGVRPPQGSRGLDRGNGRQPARVQPHGARLRPGNMGPLEAP